MHSGFDESLAIIVSTSGASALEILLSSLDIPSVCLLVLDAGTDDDLAAVSQRMGIKTLRLDASKNYLDCCNIGLATAHANGKKFLYIINSTVRFVTPVGHELMAEMMRDQNLAIVAPSQLIADTRSDRVLFASRATWDLEDLECGYDFTVFNPEIDRVESDFCQLDVVLTRVEALVGAGGFDNRFDASHGGADLAYRLRMHGRSLAYLQRSQVENRIDLDSWTDQSPSSLERLASGRETFCRKNLGYGVDYKDHGSAENHSWNIVNKNLYPSMRRHGLIDRGRPELVFGHPGADPYDYLYTVWETNELPQAWKRYDRAYKAVCAPSTWNVEVLLANNFQNIHYVPLGVDTDIYTPFGPSQREFDCPVYLWFARNQHRKGLDVLLGVWSEFRKMHADAVLVIMGHDVLRAMGAYKSEMRRRGKFVTLDFPSDRVYYRQVVSPLSDAEVALAYRSVDYLVCTSRSEGFGFSIAEAMACGTTPIFPDYSSLSDFVVPQSLCFGGTVVPADYSDRGFGDVGHWWDPDPSGLLACLGRTVGWDDSARADSVASGLDLVRNRFTWRNTCFALRNMLGCEQSPRDMVSASRSGPAPRDPDIGGELLVHERAARANVRAHIEAGFSIEAAGAFADFNSGVYEDINPDVREVGINGLSHFIQYGFRENRSVSQGVSAMAYLKLNSDARRFIMEKNDISASDLL